MCYNFKGINFISTHLKSIIDNFVLTDTKFTLIYPEFNVSDTFSKKIATFNNLILHEQIKTINESIRMVQNRNMYFQNLLLTIFLEQKICNFNFLKQKSFRLENIVFFKNILESRIKKCINFLRMYNINIHNIF